MSTPFSLSRRGGRYPVPDVADLGVDSRRPCLGTAGPPGHHAGQLIVLAGGDAVTVGVDQRPATVTLRIDLGYTTEIVYWFNAEC